MAIIEAGLLTVDDLQIISKRTKIVGMGKHGEPVITGPQMQKADFVVVRTHKGLVLIKSRVLGLRVGMRVHEERVRYTHSNGVQGS